MAKFDDVSAKRVIGLVLGVVLVAVAGLAPDSWGLTREGMLALGLLGGAVVFWVCDVLPMGVTGLLATVLLFPLGAVDTFAQAFSGFTTLNVWFILAVFSMTAIMSRSTLGLRLARRLIDLSGSDSRRLVLAFMGVSAIVSTVMTDAGAAVVTMSIAIAVLNSLGAERGSSNLGRCLLLGITFAAFIGGFATPVSHALNVVGSGIYQQATGQAVSFVEWAAVGVPMALLMVPITWFFLVRAFPPEPIDAAVVGRAVDDAISIGEWSLVDTKALAFVVAMPVAWVASSFTTVLDPTIVTIIGLACMFLPFVDLLDWRYFAGCVNWNVFLMLGGIMCLGNAIQSTGAAAFFSGLFMGSGILDLSPFVVMLVVAFAVYALQTVLPVAPAFLTLLLPLLIPYAQAVGISPLIPVLVMCSLLAGNFLLPLNPNSVVTYSEGYYSFFDMFRGGWKAAVVHVVLVVTVSFAVTALFA
ncbi:MAG: carboxylate transporter [Eggerthellaceae bacterium]|nr:carboxylate transporter [Eggerthellaceae bacterium]